jgi:DtxR family Mn-dependent transcriptional regulator
MGYAWDRVHDEAERLEHAASDELIDRMAAALGEPVTDPHGAPIPTRDGTVDETPHRTLADAPVGSRWQVIRVEDEDPGMLRHLDSLGLRPGAMVTLAGRAPYGGPLTLAVGSATCLVGRALAARVQVAPAAA